MTPSVRSELSSMKEAMKAKTKGFWAVDFLLILMMLLPLAALIFLKIVTSAPSEGIAITGAQVYFVIPMSFGDLPVTESQVNSLAVLIVIFALCLYMTHGIRRGVATKRQLLAEWMVEKLDGMVGESMGDFFASFPPFIAAILVLSALSSLLSLLGLYAPTSDVNIVGGWAILVFALITYYRAILGPWQYLKSFGEPVAFLAPLNVISEVATPVSMAFRHYGNVLSGAVISVLLTSGLEGLSTVVFGKLPGILGDFPLFRVGLPAVLSLYFDVFSGLLQAYIFAMLTMLYVSGAFPQDEYEKRCRKKLEKKKQKVN